MPVTCGRAKLRHVEARPHRTSRPGRRQARHRSRKPAGRPRWRHRGRGWCFSDLGVDVREGLGGATLQRARDRADQVLFEHLPRTVVSQPARHRGLSYRRPAPDGPGTTAWSRPAPYGPWEHGGVAALAMLEGEWTLDAEALAPAQLAAARGAVVVAPHGLRRWCAHRRRPRHRRKSASGDAGTHHNRQFCEVHPDHG